MPEGYSWLVVAGFLLIFLGVILVFLGVFLQALQGGSGEAEAGGVVVIGPIPIIVGTSGRAAVAAAVLGLVIMLLSILLLWLLGRGAGVGG